MQGLWKDKRKHYLKDKAKAVFKRRECLPQDKQEIYIDSDEHLFYKEHKFTVFVKSEVFSVVAKRNTPSSFTFNKCMTCELSVYNGARVRYHEEHGYPLNTVCSKFSYKLDIDRYPKRSYYARRLEIDNPYCQKYSLYMSHNTNYRNFLVYYDYIKKELIDFVTQMPLEKEWNVEMKWDSNKRIFIPIGKVQKQIEPIYQTFEDSYSERIYFYGKNRHTQDFIYGKPVEERFFYKYFYESRKTVCKKLANRATRARSKAWVNKINKDTSLYCSSFQESHSCEKSISWCIW